LIFDISLGEYYNIFFFLKRHANFSITELENITPFEFEIYYYLAIKAYKDEKEVK